MLLKALTRNFTLCRWEVSGPGWVGSRAGYEIALNSVAQKGNFPFYVPWNILADYIGYEIAGDFSHSSFLILAPPRVRIRTIVKTNPTYLFQDKFSWLSLERTQGINYCSSF